MLRNISILSSKREGIILEKVSNLVIIDSNIEICRLGGVDLLYSSNISILNTTFSENGISASIFLSNTVYCNISGNSFFTEGGISLGANSNNNTISYNTFSKNTQDPCVGENAFNLTNYIYNNSCDIEIIVAREWEMFIFLSIGLVIGGGLLLNHLIEKRKEEH